MGIGVALAACSDGSTREVPYAAEDDSVRVPPLGERAESEPEPAKEELDTVAETPPAARDDDGPGKPPECPTEKEPNNETSQATEFTSCITGELTSWTDTDNIKIVAPQGAAEMVIDHIEPQGKIQYSVSTPGGNGSFSMSFTDKAPQTKVTGGTTYVFSLKWDNNGQGSVSDARTYAVRVAFLH